jgi:hypothetical protein
MFSLNVSQKFRFPFLEKVMVVHVVSGHSSLFVEVVHVKLSYKRVHIAVFEVDWKHFLAELLGVTYDYEVPAVAPADDVSMRTFFEEFVGLSNERGDSICGHWGLNVEFFFESK